MHAHMHDTSSHKVCPLKNFTRITRTWRHTFKLCLILILAIPQL